MFPSIRANHIRLGVTGVAILLICSGCLSYGKSDMSVSHPIFGPITGVWPHRTIDVDKQPLSSEAMSQVLESADIELMVHRNSALMHETSLVSLDSTGRGWLRYPMDLKDLNTFHRWETQIQVNPEGMAIIRRQFVSRHYQDWPLSRRSNEPGPFYTVHVKSKTYRKNSVWGNSCTSDMASLFSDVESVVTDSRYTTVLSTKTTDPAREYEVQYQQAIKAYKAESDARDRAATQPSTQPAATQPATVPSAQPVP